MSDYKSLTKSGKGVSLVKTAIILSAAGNCVW